jgi:ParB-like chromosome segregation protein Spo0J
MPEILPQPATAVEQSHMRLQPQRRRQDNGANEQLKVAYRSLAELIPYARNARTHSPQQINKIKASLARYGWTNPMLIAGNDMIAGHARLAAAMEMLRDNTPIPRLPDQNVGPTIDLSHLSPQERRAYVIADNRLALDAAWDDNLLNLEMTDLSLQGFDLSLTGFDMGEITNILAPPPNPDEAPTRELTKAEDDMLDAAWARIATEWNELFATYKTRRLVSTSFTKGALAVLYLRALFFGRSIPRAATLAYTPHRVDVPGDAGSLVLMTRNALPTNPDQTAARAYRHGIRYILNETPSYDKLFSSTLPVRSQRLPNDFPSDLARDLINEFTPNSHSTILDPCHGWGGRLLGFLLADRATAYHGYDTSPLSHAGVQDMFNELSALTPHRKKTATLTCQPYEDASLQPNAFDFAITSPPYFDIEQYEGDQSSWRRYSNFDTWVDGFYKPLIAKTANALKAGAFFALQVGSQTHPLVNIAQQIATSYNLSHVETRHTDMVNNRTGTEPDVGEVVMLLRKP